VTCEAITPGVACRYPGPVTIDPGGAVNFDLRVIVPGTAAGQTLRSIAFILWEEMPFPGGDGTPLNDVDDMEIDFGDEPPVPPPAGAGVDLAITKVVAPDQTCQPGGRCLFLVDIENTGDEPIAERLIVREVATIDGSVQVPATAIAHGDGVLLCTRIGETPFDRHCVVNYAGGEGLAPGATITTEIYVNITESVVADAVLQNCVQIAWDAMDFPGGRDDNPANDGEVCVTVDVVAEDPPITEPADESAQIDLRIEKSAPETCTRGEVCRFSTSIFNDGPGQYVGPLQITDRLFQWEDRPVPSEAPRVIPPQWTCAPDSANRGAVCTLGANDALTLDRFHSMPLAFEWTVPMDEPLGWLRNCARVRWPGAPSEDSMVFAELMLAHAGFDPGDVDGTITDETLNAVREFRIREGLSADGGFDAALFEALYQGTGALSADSFTDNNRHCADTTIVERGADLEPEGDTSCQRGEDCDLSVRIRNSGDLPFVGDAGMTGRLTPEVPIAEVQGITPGLTCSVQGVGEYVCRGSALSLKPGEAAEIRLVISVPANFAADQITHAKTMVWPDVAVKDDYPDNDRDESIITIEGALPPQQLAAPDLAITKTAGQGTCQAGQSCRFNIQVRNVGTRPYVGPIRIVDNLNVSGVRLVSSAPSDWRCRLSRGRVSCTTARTTLEPGQTRSLSLTLRTARSARGSAENCAALDWTPQTTAMSVQQALNELGFNAGSVDGKPGRNTRWAIRNYEAVVGIPDIGEIDDTLLGRLFESWGVGDGVANNDRACATINLSAPPQPEPQIEPVRPDPVVPPPVAGPECARGEIQVSRRRARTLSAQGWRVRTVQRGGLSILCARQVAPPPPPPCTGGRVRNPQGECVCPANRPVWNGRACIRRAPPPSCPRGWRQLTRQQAKALVPQGWEVRQFGNLLCGRQRAVSPTCPRGWKQVNRQQAKALVAQGWRIRQVGNLLCARQR
jgi:peptidoglycan hydrolase-like protein with peptidoglycan-binding domain